MIIGSIPTETSIDYGSILELTPEKPKKSVMSSVPQRGTPAHRIVLDRHQRHVLDVPNDSREVFSIQKICHQYIPRWVPGWVIGSINIHG